jgi:hypothetical protein
VIRLYNYDILDFLENNYFMVKKLKRLKTAHLRRLAKKKKMKKYKWLHGPLNGQKLSKFYIKNKKIWYIRKKNYLINILNNYKHKNIINLNYLNKEKIIDKC